MSCVGGCYYAADDARRSPRASWTQTELFLTFPPPLLGSITLQPLNTPETGGQFRVWIDTGVNGWQLVWDRKVGVAWGYMVMYGWG